MTRPEPTLIKSSSDGLQRIVDWLETTYFSGPSTSPDRTSSHGLPLRILIDGPSGSGKTTLAQNLGEVLNIPVFGSEYWAPGWEGLQEGSKITEELVSGAASTYRRWDWESYSFAEEIPFDATGAWIIEGCGSLTPGSAPYSNLRVWVEADPDIAKSRGLTRDGEAYAQHWDAWHRQEVEHWERNNPSKLADIIIRTDR